MGADDWNILKPSIWLACSVGLILAALKYNSPAPKRVDFDIVCERFLAPVALSLDLNRNAQIYSAVLYGFDGSASNIAGLTLAEATTKQHMFTPGSFTLAHGANQPAPYLKIIPGGEFGTMRVDVQPGVSLSIPTAATIPTLKVESLAHGDTHLLLQSGKVNLNGNRYVIPEVFHSQTVIDQFSMDIRGRLPGVFLNLTPALVASGPVRAEIGFAPAAGPTELMIADQGNGIPSGTAQLTFSGVLSPDIRVEGKGASGIISDHKTNFKMAPKRGRILSIGIANNPDKKDSPVLEVKGRIEAYSVEEDGHEILPTLIEEVLGKPWAERKYWLVFLGFVAFAIFKIIDRTFELLLKLVLPEV